MSIEIRRAGGVVTDWTKATCRDDPELWYADDFQGQATATIGCHTCPLLSACREWILGPDSPEHGKSHYQRYGIVAAMTPSARVKAESGHLVGDGIDHGTASGYRKHLRRGERACGPCTDANNERTRINKAAYRARRAQAKSEAARAVTTGGLRGRRVS